MEFLFSVLSIFPFDGFYVVFCIFFILEVDDEPSFVVYLVRCLVGS